MLKCSASLWSADLTNLENEIRRVEPFTDSFHLDVADGHYTPTLLFFPDLVAQIRPLTTLPLEVHLMTERPLDWIEPFVEAGVDGFIFCYRSLGDVGQAVREVKRYGKWAGVSLEIQEPPELLEPYWQDLRLVTVVGTAIGIKGATMDPSIPDKIRLTRSLISQAGASTEVQSDGGIRRETVPQMMAAGSQWIVPGSLMFKDDPAEMHAWLASLEASDYVKV